MSLNNMTNSNRPNISGSRRLFTKEEDDFIRQLVQKFGDSDFKKIALYIPNRTTRQCRERYKNYLAPELKNGAWTKEEDDLLKQKVKEIGQKWTIIASFFPTRSDVNIKNRWVTISGKIHPSFKVTVIPPKIRQPSVAPLPLIHMPPKKVSMPVMPIIDICNRNINEFDLNFEKDDAICHSFIDEDIIPSSVEWNESSFWTDQF